MNSCFPGALTLMWFDVSNPVCVRTQCLEKSFVTAHRSIVQKFWIIHLSHLKLWGLNSISLARLSVSHSLSYFIFITVLWGKNEIITNLQMKRLYIKQQKIKQKKSVLRGLGVGLDEPASWINQVTLFSY